MTIIILLVMQNQKYTLLESKFWDLARILCWLMQSKLFQFSLIQCRWRMTYTYKCGGTLQMFVVQTEWKWMKTACTCCMWKWVVCSYRLCGCYDSGFIRYNNDWVYKLFHVPFSYFSYYFSLFIWKVLNCSHVYELVWNCVFMYWKWEKIKCSWCLSNEIFMSVIK